ncbi:MAG: efflux RND transporter periplasmic adaptor subunit [Pseudomonadota bacterium]
MTSTTSSNKQKRILIAVIVIGILLGGAILLTGKSQPAGDEHGHGGHEESGHAEKGGDHEEGESEEGEEHEIAKGPHGGKLFTDGDYALEVTIFEQGVEPQFRLYTYLKDKPLDPAQSKVELTLERLGRAPQVFKFAKEGDYLKGDAIVIEPHSFKVTATATHAGKQHKFAYEQVEARVTMNDAQVQQAGVEIATAGPAKIATKLQLLGEVRYNGDRTVHVVPRTAGRVESVAVSAGEAVKKGQVLAVLSSQMLADQRSEQLAAQKRLTLARTSYAREKKLWEEKISAEQDYLQAQATLQEAEIAEQSSRQKLVALGGTAAGSGSDLTRFEIRSPIDGIVTEKNLSVGEALKEDSAVFSVSDLSTVWVEAPVAVQNLAAISGGQKATVRANAFTAEAEGKIAYVSALVGEQTRSAMARIVLANPKGLWRPGLPVTVDVVSNEAQVSVAVEAEAIQSVRERQVVFGRYGDAFEARPLTLGRSDGRFVEVLEGLDAGEKYATKNSFLIKADIGKSGASHDH